MATSYSELSVFVPLHSKGAWWGIPVIPTLGKLRQEDLEFEASLSDIASSRPVWVILATIIKEEKIAFGTTICGRN
jgi:hypothetical protein